MDSCDVLIVGGGPAGSSCAWKLVRSGLNTVVVDKSAFPRNKVCGGWITPQVLSRLEISTGEYASSGNTLQPITGFRTGCLGGRQVETNYGQPISYGIRRCEFDDFLLRRSKAHFLPVTPLESLRRSGEEWIFNERIRTRMIVGAGGHFCPVARYLGADARHENAVIAQETEFEMTPLQCNNTTIGEKTPELYFCPDMKGYGWCFRKNNFLNIGLGRLDAQGLPAHVQEFIQFLEKTGKVGFELPTTMVGHAYLLLQHVRRKIIGEGVLLIGDAAGLAYTQSGEGILPAIESGLLAADAIISAGKRYDMESLDGYRRQIMSMAGESGKDWTLRLGQFLPAGAITAISKQLLATEWFSRQIVDRWFLHVQKSATAVAAL